MFSCCFCLHLDWLIISPHLSSSGPVAHKVAVDSFQFPLFLATRLASFQDFQPSSFLSFSTVRLHVVLGRPTFRRPSGFHVNAVIQSLLSSILSTCPIHFHLLILTSSLILLSLVLLSISSLDMTYGHLIFNILLQHLNMKVSILLLSTSFTLHASHPYNSTDLTSALKRPYFGLEGVYI